MYFRPARCIRQNFYFSKEYGEAPDLKAWKGIFRSILLSRRTFFFVFDTIGNRNFNLRFFREFLFSISKIMWIYFVSVSIVEFLQFIYYRGKFDLKLNFQSFQPIRWNNSNYISINININYNIIPTYTL